MPGQFRRDLTEWLCAALALATAIKVLYAGEARLGAWILWSPHVHLWMVTAAWTSVFVWVSGFQAFALSYCHRVTPNIEGVCGLCEHFPRCAANRLRRGAALQAALAWVMLFFAFRNFEGAVYLVMAAMQFYVFTTLSPAPTWLKISSN